MYIHHLRSSYITMKCFNPLILFIFNFLKKLLPRKVSNHIKQHTELRHYSIYQPSIHHIFIRLSSFIYYYYNYYYNYYYFIYINILINLKKTSGAA